MSEHGIPVLAVRCVAVAAGGVPLLHGVDLNIRAGERLALVGPSGCGKTTLLRAICLLDDPASGSLLLLDRTPDQWGYPAYRRQVVLVEQRPSLTDHTIENVLQRPFTYRSTTHPFPRDRAVALIDQLAIGAHRLDQPARSLSQGQQQRLSLIRAMLLNPRVLLLDEPTSALDGDSAALVERAIADQCATGTAVIVVTHDLELASRWCDRTLDLRPYMTRSATEVANASS